MADEWEAPTPNRKARVEHRRPPQCVAIAERGIRTAPQFAGFMSALIGDIVSRRMTPEVGNAACNAGGKLLKVVEMQYKYGSRMAGDNEVLTLAPGVQQ